MERVVYTPKEVSILLRIRLATVYDLIKSNDLPALRIGKNYKVPKEGFEEWLLIRTREQMEEREKHDTT